MHNNNVIPHMDKLMKQVKILFLLIFCFPVSANQQASFPAELIGKWSPEISNCAAEFRWVDEGVSAVRNMVISASQVMFWESQGTLISIIKSGNNYVANLEMAGEGETWNENQAFILSNNGNKLSRTARNYEFNYHRCEK